MGWPHTAQFYVPENCDHLRLMYNRPNRRGIEATERLTPAMCHNRPMLSYRENSSEATYLALNVQRSTVKNNSIGFFFRVCVCGFFFGSFFSYFVAMYIFCGCLSIATTTPPIDLFLFLRFLFKWFALSLFSLCKFC